MRTAFLRYTTAALLVWGALYSANGLAETSTAVAESQTATSQQAVGFHYLNAKIQKSPTDKAAYKAIRLENGMEVLLISDESANKSLFAVGLPVGSMEDPIEQQGLAHYLEHMILMGSKAFPETNSLDAFLTKHGGMNNAYTAPDRTVYYLQVNHAAFDEAVARLSDAFAAPLLSETNAKKEVNAVNAEMVRAKSSDGHLVLAVNRATSNPAHPMTKFAVGNKESLSDKPNSRLHDELGKFYQQYYSANLMKAVLYSNQTLDKLATLASQTLGKVENKNLTVPTVDVPLLREQDRGVVIHYKPVVPTKLLAISFDMPEDKAEFKRKSGEYLSYMFSNNTEGTLADYLVKQGLSDSGISADYTADVSRNRGDFTLYIYLTEKGLKEQDHILSLVFQQIEQIKQAGIQQSYFDELKESLSQDFQHLRVDKNFNYVAELVSQMLIYPLENIIDQPYVTTEMDTQAIKDKLDLMTIENARILVVDEKAITDRKTPYFEAPYAIAKMTEAQKAKWQDFQHNPSLKLPQPNPYFTTDFSLNKVDKSRSVPTAVVEQAGTQIYAMPSRYFSEEAKARVQISFAIEPKEESVKQTVSAALLNIMDGLSRRKMDFQASVAGLNAELVSGENGIELNAEGYTQNLANLLYDYLLNFSRFELTQAAFEQAKQRYAESLDALEKENAQRQASAALSNFGQFPYYELAHKREALAQVSLADIQQLRDKLRTAVTGVRLLSVGNFADEQLQALLKRVETVIANKNQTNETDRYLDISQSQRKLNFIKSIPHEDNAFAISYFPNGYDEIDGNVRASLLGNIIANWYFDDLRTDKQLGYVVSARPNRFGKTAGLTFTVQSPTASPKTIMEHNQRFIKESADRLNAMPTEEFEKYRNSLLDILQHKPDSLLREFSDYSRDFARGNYRFDRKAKMIERLSTLTKQEMLDFYQQALVKQRGFVFASQAIGTKAEINQVAELNGFERVESIEKLQKEFEIKRY